jgi:predicted N-acetyltransferase YhbS
VTIEPLVHSPRFLPLLAEWHHSEWGYLRPGSAITDRIARLEATLNTEELPITFIARSDTELLGSAMLVPCDMDTRQDLSPWLAGVFVTPAYRSRGIGTALTKHVLHQAFILRFPIVYLYTLSSEALYSRLGWSVLDRTRYLDSNVTVMSFIQAQQGAAANP